MIAVIYATSSSYKQAEAEALHAQAVLPNGQPVSSVFSPFEYRTVKVKEQLEANLSEMVRAEAIDAYRNLAVPCIVEHAGLVWQDYAEASYPGGLTKPMWNTLGDRFLEETHSVGRPAIARAVVGYCDGMTVRLFVGETRGRMAASQPAEPDFYWDSVFIPEQEDGTPGTATYAEIKKRPNGLADKVSQSQSSKALLQFLHYRSQTEPRLWP